MTYQTISDTQKVDYLFKKLGWGVAKTDQNQTGGKDAYQEAIPSPLLLRGDKIWTQAADIPAIIPASNSSVVTLYNDYVTNTVECTEDSNDTLNVTWLTNLPNWIPIEFGSTYLIKAYIAPTGTPNPQTTGIPIYSQGSGNNDQWFFDYQSGVLNFAGANLPTYSNSTPIDLSGKSVFISGARYTGGLGVSSFADGATFGNITISGNTITGNSNITFGGNITAGNIIATGEFYGKFSGLIETGSQPDITSLGNLTNLTVNTYILSNTITSNTLTVNGNANVGNILTNGFYYPNGTPWVFYSNANVSAYLPTYNGNIGGNIGINGNLTVYSGNIFAPTANLTQVNAGNISVTNNVQMGNLLTNAFFWGNGVPIVFSNYGNSNVVAYFANVINNDTFYGNIVADTISPFKTNVTIFNSNTAVGMPRGNTATRPGSAISGYTRFNTDTESLEFYNGTNWSAVTNNITDQTITGDGVNFVFDLTEPASPIGILVSINGVIQLPNQAYTTTPNQIIFAQIPNSTDVIDIRFLGAMSSLSSTLADDLYVTGNLHVSGNILSNLLVYTYGNSQVTTYLNSFPGNIIPFSNNNFNLGSNVESWQTLYLGGLPITVSNNNLVLNGNIVSGNYGNANVATYLASGNDPTISTINTNITGTNQAIVAANTAIVNLVTSIVTNANANTAAYLTTATGNINAGNISTISNIQANGGITSAGNISTISSVIALTMQTTGPSGNIRGVNVINANSVSITNGIFWAGNGAPYSSGSGGGSSFGNADVAAYLVANPQGSTYSNANVTAYLATGTDTTLLGLIGNTTASNAAIVTANTAVVSYVNTLNSAMLSNVAGANAAIVTANTAMKGYVDAGNTTMTSYVGNQVTTANTAMKSYVDAGNTTMTSYVGNQVTTANTAMKGYVDAVSTAWTAANTIQSNQITGANTAIVTANSAVVSYVNTLTNSLATGANANTLAYLNSGFTVSGNITAGNISNVNIISANSVQLTNNLTSTGNITISGNITTPGLAVTTYANITAPLVLTNNTGVDSLQIIGTAVRGGAGYHDFLQATNLGGGTNINKWFRLDSTGQYQIINSAYSTNIFNLTDAGQLTVPTMVVSGNLQVQGTTTTVNQSTLSVSSSTIFVSVGSTTNTQANGAGLSVAGANANLYYTAIGDQWNTNKPFYAPGIYDGAARVVSTSSGAGNLTISGTGVNLTSVGPGAVTTGSATAIPVITTDAYGRISGITTAAVSSTLNTAGNTGTGTVSLTSQSLSIGGTNGLTATASGQTITITDNNWVWANANLGTATTNITALQANLGGYYAWANANVAGLSSQIVGANAAIVTANTALKGYTDNQISTANTAVVNYVNTRTNSLATGANTNTAAYLAAGISTNITSTGTITGGNLSANNANITNYLYVGSAVTNLYKTVPLTVTGANAGNTITGINIVNTGGGGGSGSGIDFYTYTGAGYPPEASIYSVDNGDYSANINFDTKIPGSGTNALATRMTISSTGNVNVPGNINVGNVYLNGALTSFGYVNGSVLVAVNTADQTATQNAAVSFPTNQYSVGTAITKTSNTQFTLAAGNTYKLKFTASRLVSSSSWGAFQWYSVTDSAYVGVRGFFEAVTSSATGVGSNVETIAYVTPTRPTTYSLYQTEPNTITLNGGYGVLVEITQVNPAIAVQATATGTLNTDYIQAGRITSAQTVSNAATPQDVIFNTTIATNSAIAQNTSTGVFTLTAGKTYELEAQLTYATMAANSNYILFTWVDATTNAALETSGTSVGSIVPTSWGSQAGNPNSSYGAISKVIYTPSTNQTVKVRITAGIGSGSIYAGQGTYAKITQIANQFALNALNTMTTTGNVSVGGNLAVTGNIAGTAVKITAPTFQAVTPSWGLGDVASAVWFLLGTWNTSNAGNLLYMRLIAHAGYNAVATDNQVTELTFATANGDSYITGSSGNFYANGLASVNSRLGTGGTSPSYKAPNKFRIVQVSQTQYQIYAYFSAAYMRNSNYSIQISPGDTWVDGGGSGTVSAPGGNYIDITPTAF